MFANLLWVSLVIILIWLVSYGLYWYASNQHHDLSKELEELRRELE